MSNIARDIPVELDADGFLAHPEEWNELIASQLAERDGIGPLTDAHWSVIQSLRKHYYSSGGIPPLRHVCVENNLEPHCVPQLFKDTGRELWRIAGLPNPGEEAKTYL
ncbi:MAG: TusE/DsrC/DsvC family sulfur relay protein [Gammaproteobacteria bacterium]|jgi:tRNA 2-thiouridine synthesizing protein E|nr:TusE/DsrC/DsvC family sulfur relay protein [Gammaproteobacteria bacterium]